VALSDYLDASLGKEPETRVMYTHMVPRPCRRSGGNGTIDMAVTFCHGVAGWELWCNQP
jgi:hypothetical protein